MTENVCVITVTHNSADVLRSLLATLPPSVDKLIVDNASHDDSCLIGEACGARVLPLDSNIGYGPACNVGAEATDAEFLLFVNPDVLIGEGAVEAFLEAARAFPDAAFNPRIYSLRKRRFRRRSRLLPATRHWAGEPPDADCSIPILSGACIFIRRAHFERIGGFDPAIFLFHEDDDLSVRLMQAGVELRLAAKARIQHDEGNSSTRSPRYGRLKGEAMGRSLVHVMRKHGLPLDLSAERRRARAKFFLPYVAANATRRAKLRGFLDGLGDGEAPET